MQRSFQMSTRVAPENLGHNSKERKAEARVGGFSRLRLRSGMVFAHKEGSRLPEALIGGFHQPMGVVYYDK